MERTGILIIKMGNSRLVENPQTSGTLLAIQGAGNPLGAATNFLVNQQFVSGDPIIVTGTNGTLGTEPVIFMTNVQHAPVPVFSAAGAVNVAAGGKQASVKRRATKKRGAQKASKKRAGKKRGGGKKATTKSAVKKAAGKGTKKGGGKRK